MSENTQPESAAKVEEIAQQIAEAGFHRDCGNHSPRVIESELEDIESILRPFIPSQPPALDVSRILRLMEWLLDVFPENVANEVGTKDNDNFHECGDLVRELRELAAPVTPVSQPPRLTMQQELDAMRVNDQPPDLDWDKVHSLLEPWQEVWNGDKGKYLGRYPEWMVNAAAELFAHDICDAWSWTDYVAAATVIISRHYLAPVTPVSGNGPEPQWRLVNGIEIRWDEEAKVFVGKKTIYSQSTTEETAIEAVKSAIRLLAETKWATQPTPKVEEK